MHRPLALLCLPLSALALAACGNTVSTASFKGAQHEVAQTIANFQAAATAAEEKKICTEDLAAPLVARLGGTKRCEAAIKSQLTEVDSLEASVESVKLGAGGKTATAQVKSVHEGKKATSALALVDEGGKWKISGLG
ncbi:MAG: hypothetical protein JWN10_2666 [Solirubrobacterales bacterium]|nr:hypothetical protein [Solirubrobacterales bacterium]